MAVNTLGCAPWGVHCPSSLCSKVINQPEAAVPVSARLPLHPPLTHTHSDTHAHYSILCTPTPPTMASSQYAQNTPGCSRDGSVSSECGDAAVEAGGIALPPAPKQPATNFPLGSMAPNSNGNAGYPQVTDAPSTRLTVAALQALDAAFPAHTYTHLYMVGDEEPTDGGQYHWYCCRCGWGPLNVSLDVECLNCNDHPRCGNCEVHPTK